NCPRASMVSSLCLGIVVSALAKHASDGVNRRHIDHVESKFGDVWQTFFAIRKGAVLARLVGSGAGKEFVPGTESCADGIDYDRVFKVRFCCVSLVRIAKDELMQQWIRGVSAKLDWLFSGAQDCSTLCDPLRICPGGPFCGFFYEFRSNLIVNDGI